MHHSSICSEAAEISFSSYFIRCFFFLLIGIVICGNLLSKCARIPYISCYIAKLKHDNWMWVWTFLSLCFIFHFLIGIRSIKPAWKTRKFVCLLFSSILSLQFVYEWARVIYLCMLAICNVWILWIDEGICCVFFAFYSRFLCSNSQKIVVAHISYIILCSLSWYVVHFLWPTAHYVYHVEK